MGEPGNGGTPPPYGQQPNQAGSPPSWSAPSGEPTYPQAPPPPPGYGYGGYPQPQTRSNGLAVASLVCGIIGLLIFGVVLGPLAVVFGAIGLSRANQGASGKGMAIAGLVLGAVATILAIVLLVAIANGRLVI
jgi:Domain of unknown function (DUF4190)